MSDEGILAPPLSPSVNPANTGQISHDEINKTVQGELTKKEAILVCSIESLVEAWLCRGILWHHWTWA